MANQRRPPHYNFKRRDKERRRKEIRADMHHGSHLRLFHYSFAPLATIRSEHNIDPEGVCPIPGAKPAGFWVSVRGPNDWPAYIRRKKQNLGQYWYKISLRSDSNILLISGIEELKKFSEIYELESLKSRHISGIDWTRVSGDFQGIIISPWIQPAELRLDLLWYMTWDCASGCIWDSSAIQSFRLMNRMDFHNPLNDNENNLT